MIALLKLIRWQSIGFAIFVLYAMRYWVVRPILEINGFSLQMSNLAFVCLVISVCALIAGAYVINDYFDVKADRMSGLRNITIGGQISRRRAIVFHSLLNILALVLALGLSIKVGVWKISILFLLVSGLLWFYSGCYKRYFIIGNLLAALLTALIPLSVLLFEIPLLNKQYIDIMISNGFNFLYLFKWIGGFSCFIFLNMLIYEMNKDMYTRAGDEENGVCTFPVKLGNQMTVSIISLLVFIVLAFLIIVYLFVFRGISGILWYMVFVLGLPYVIYLILLSGGETLRFYQLNLIRLIVLMGVGFSYLFSTYFLC